MSKFDDIKKRLSMSTTMPQGSGKGGLLSNLLTGGHLHGHSHGAGCGCGHSHGDEDENDDNA